MSDQLRIVDELTVTRVAFSWHIFDKAGDYLGLVSKFGGPFGRYTLLDDPLRFRAYTTGPDLDGVPAAVEAEFPTQAEAEAWLLDGHEEAEP